MKRVFIVLIASLLLLVLGFFVISSYIYNKKQDPSESSGNTSLSEGCPYGDYYTLTKGNEEYKNSKRGYSLVLPKDYYFPTNEENENESDPHFYDCVAGIGFELQDGTRSFEELSARQDTETIITTSVFPGATISGGKYTGDYTKGWDYIYTVVYSNEKRGFVFASNRPISEYVFLSTFKIF
ncbi:MAG: hypothetical protein AB202_02155 [Parcubacteria bacterium C7867-007]|nr:MAG: hypothetical protein AB202_02155 [Parcubacteria bacterium C7867-007]